MALTNPPLVATIGRPLPASRCQPCGVLSFIRERPGSKYFTQPDSFRRSSTVSARGSTLVAAPLARWLGREMLVNRNQRPSRRWNYARSWRAGLP